MEIPFWYFPVTKVGYDYVIKTDGKFPVSNVKHLNLFEEK